MRRGPTLRSVLLYALDSAGQVEELEATLHAAGYRIVPMRRPAFTNRTLTCIEGQINSRTLIEAAAEFDEISGADRFSATDFMAWFIPEIQGTVEYGWMQRANQRRVREAAGPKVAA